MYIQVKRKKGAKFDPRLDGPKRVKVGFPKSKSEASEIQKAVWQEFGTRGGKSGGGWGGPIPERPFMRTAISNNIDKYKAALRAGAKSMVNGTSTAEKVLGNLGVMAQRHMQKSISTWTTPALSPTTVKLKGSNKPLVQTGSMFSAVTYEVIYGNAT